MNVLKIEENTPFKTSVYKVKITNASSLTPYLEHLSNNIRSVQKSNAGGWQSPQFLYNDHDIIKPFLNMAQFFVQDLYKKFDVQAHKATLDNYWVNINPPNTYNKPHTHPRSYFSTVLYCKVPRNSGDLYFERPDEMYSYIPTVNQNEYNTGVFSMPPEQDTMILFPSHLRHGVELNKSNETRISIAMNWR